MSHTPSERDTVILMRKLVEKAIRYIELTDFTDTDSYDLDLAAELRAALATAPQVPASEPAGAGMAWMNGYAETRNSEGGAPQVPAIKDHEIAEVVNKLRLIALQFGETQQLRARIADVVVPLLKNAPVQVPAEADSKWISVDDRLPDPDTWVITYVPEFALPEVAEFYMQQEETANMGQPWIEVGYGFDRRTVTHWMPLPAPPAIAKESQP